MIIICPKCGREGFFEEILETTVHVELDDGDEGGTQICEAEETQQWVYKCTWCGYVMEGGQT